MLHVRQMQKAVWPNHSLRLKRSGGRRRQPLVVMAHGTSATIQMLAIEYARVFARSGWVNEVTRVTPPTPIAYSPYLCTPFAQAKTLFMVAPDDEMVHANYDVARQAYDLIPTQKRWYDIRDGHFGLLYHPGERFEEAARVQSAFLRANLDA